MSDTPVHRLAPEETLNAGDMNKYWNGKVASDKRVENYGDNIGIIEFHASWPPSIHRVSDQNQLNFQLPDGQFTSPFPYGIDDFKDTYIHDVAMMLEGRIPVKTTMPDFEDHGSRITRLSKYLSAKTRHGTSRIQNIWIDLSTLIDERSDLLDMAFPEELIVAVMLNPKQRFKFSVPQFVRYSDYHGENKVFPRIFICAVQGHSNTDIEESGLMRELTLDNSPPVAVHGCQYTAAAGIRKSGKMIPGGPNQTRDACHFATSLPHDENEVISGFRTASPLCIFIDLLKWLKAGHQAYISQNKVVSIFEEIPVSFLTDTDRQ